MREAGGWNERFERTQNLRSCVAAEEDRCDVAVIQVLSYVAGDDGLVGLEEAEVAWTHFCGDFEADVEELTEAAVIGLGTGNVAEGGGVLVGGPCADCGG